MTKLLRGTAIGELGTRPSSNQRKMNEARIPLHADTGCALSPSCLNCVLPKCVEDMSAEQRIELLDQLKP
jgi:hypothetical protein